LYHHHWIIQALASASLALTKCSTFLQPDACGIFGRGFEGSQDGGNNWLIYVAS
jgi:hypothetical protein